MTTEMAYELLLWVLLAFSLIICALEILCVVLYRRLIATRRILGDSQSLPRPDKIAPIPTTSEMTSTTGNIYLSKIAGNVSLKGSIPKNAETKMLVTITKTIRQIMAIPFAIVKVYKWRSYLSINKEENRNF